MNEGGEGEKDELSLITVSPEMIKREVMALQLLKRFTSVPPGFTKMMDCV